MSAPLDWLLSYEHARSGGFGDQSQAVIDRIKEAAGSDFQDAIDKGWIKEPASTLRTGQNESGSFSIETPEAGGINWDSLPKMGPKDFSLPENAIWRSVGGRAGETATGRNTYEDPVYGTLELDQKKTPLSTTDKIFQSIALAMAGGPIAGSIGAAAGVTAGTFGSAALNAGVRAGLSAAFGNSPSLLGAGSSLIRPGFAELIKGA